MTSNLLRAMSDGDAATASIYDRLVDDRAKQKMTLAQFQAMSRNLIAKLGAFKELDLANRTDVSPGLGRVDVTAFIRRISRWAMRP